MRFSVSAVILLVAASLVTAGNPPKESKPNAGFDKLKALEGTWKGKDENGNPVGITYKLVSAGSAMMETLDMAENKEAMVTMYHVNKDRLMMTHYCSLGNQPRMRVDRAPKAANTLAFSYIDATNLSNPDDDHMAKLVFTFKDADHFSQAWTLHSKGKGEHPSLFEFERAK